MKCPKSTQRIQKLRQDYLEHSPVAAGGAAPWESPRLGLLRLRGWVSAKDAQTVCLRRAMTRRYVLENMPAVIFQGELIVGQTDFTPLTPEENDQYEKMKGERERFFPFRRGRGSHMGLDYEKLLRLGVSGLIDEIEAYDKELDLFDGAQLEKHEYYLCCLTELEGLLALARTYACKARELADSDGAYDRREMLEIAALLDRVPANPAATFREALESVHFYTFALFSIYSAGRPDQYLYRYFKKDMDEGRLDMESAQELIDCFCLQYMNNMASWAAAGFEVGGRTREGKYVENELTWLFLNSIYHTRASDPSIGFCVNSETSEDLLHFACEIAAQGHSHPAFWNDDGVAKSMVNYGYAEEDSHWWTHSTCVEITPIGKSGVSITSPYVNTLKVLLETLKDAPDETDFDGLIELFAQHLNEKMHRDLINENLWQLERARNSTDPFMTSCLIDDCIKRGKSHDAGGAVYNFIQPDFLGLMNVVESLNVIHQLVYEEQRLTLSGFWRILEENYENDESLRQYIVRKIPHFGNNELFTDQLAKRVADVCLNSCKDLKTYRGAKVVPGAFAYNEHATQGRTTPASPDGRKAGMPLTSGSDPVQGYDVSGPTASIMSSLAWEPTRFLGGIAVNLKLNKSTPKLPDIICAIVKTYVKNGGDELQISVMDQEVLLEAQKDPDAYRDLLVRIGGYSDFFVRLEKDLQDEIIRRSST